MDQAAQGSAELVVEYLRYRIASDGTDQFIKDYRAASRELMASPYALSFEMCQCVDEPEQFILRIEWTSADDHLKRFRGSDTFKAFFAHVRTHVGGIEEMRHYKRLPV